MVFVKIINFWKHYGHEVCTHIILLTSIVGHVVATNIVE